MKLQEVCQLIDLCFLPSQFQFLYQLRKLGFDVQVDEKFNIYAKAYEKSHFHKNRANVLFIPEIETEVIIDYTERDLNDITELVNILYPNARRGDIINIGEIHSRQEACCIWSGTQAENIGGDYEFFAIIPHTYVVDEDNFSPVWWSHVMTYHTNWWPSANIRQQCAQNMFLTSDGYDSFFIHKGVRYSLCVGQPEEDRHLTKLNALLAINDVTHPFNYSDEWGCYVDELSYYQVETDTE